jgi:hypothetical protein
MSLFQFHIGTHNILQGHSAASSALNVRSWKTRLYLQWQPIARTGDLLLRPYTWTIQPDVQLLVMTVVGNNEVETAAEALIAIVRAAMDKTTVVLPAGVTCEPGFSLQNMFARTNPRFTL